MVEVLLRVYGYGVLLNWIIHAKVVDKTTNTIQTYNTLDGHKFVQTLAAVTGSCVSMHV